MKLARRVELSLCGSSPIERFETLLSRRTLFRGLLETLSRCSPCALLTLSLAVLFARELSILRHKIFLLRGTKIPLGATSLLSGRDQLLSSCALLFSFAQQLSLFARQSFLLARQASLLLRGRTLPFAQQGSFSVLVNFLFSARQTSLAARQTCLSWRDRLISSYGGILSSLPIHLLSPVLRAARLVFPRDKHSPLTRPTYLFVANRLIFSCATNLSFAHPKSLFAQ